MLSERALADALEHITAGDFYKPAHGHIFDHACQLSSKGEPVDPVTLTDSLAGAGLLDQCGGLAGLVSLQAETPATSNAGRYASIIARHALMRRMIGVAGEIAELGYSRPDDPAPVLERAEAMVLDLAAGRQVTATAERLADLAAGWLAVLERRYEHGPEGIPTGVIDLDDRLGGGMRPGQLYFVAARPAMGKSNYGIQIAYHVARDQALPTLVFSLEMPRDEVLDRIVAGEARVDNQRIRTGRLVESDWPKISHALARFADCPLYIYDEPQVTLATIRAQARRVKAAAGGLGLVVVDYVQLLGVAERSESRRIDVDGLTRGLKLAARVLNVPVLALCQVNRNVEARSDKRPMLADLRESGGIEADGDIVIALYRDEIYKHDSADRGIAELILLKHRQGPTGTVKVSFLANYGLFANMARL